MGMCRWVVSRVSKMGDLACQMAESVVDDVSPMMLNIFPWNRCQRCCVTSEQRSWSEKIREQRSNRLSMTENDLAAACGEGVSGARGFPKKFSEDRYARFGVHRRSPAQGRACRITRETRRVPNPRWVGCSRSWYRVRRKIRGP